MSEEQLRALFDRVLTAPPPDTTDVDAAIRSGRRHRRVRTSVAVLSSAAAVAVVAGAVLSGAGPAADRVPPVAGPPASPAPRVPGAGEGYPVTSAAQLVGVWRAVRLDGRDVWTARDDGDPVLLSFAARPGGQVFGVGSDGCNAHSGRSRSPHPAGSTSADIS